MAAVTLRQAAGGAAAGVISGAIILPRTGAWHATLHLATTEKPTGAVEIRAGRLTLKGTVNRVRADAGGVRVLVLAGADGLRRLATPKHYTTPTLRVPLEDLARTAGEAISATADAQVLDKTILSWTTVALEVGSLVGALTELASRMKEFAAATISWRMLADGTLWLGRETWPDSQVTQFRVVEQSGSDNLLVLAVEVPELLPGTVVAGQRASDVEHVITPDRISTTVWLAP